MPGKKYSDPVENGDFRWGYARDGPSGYAPPPHTGNGYSDRGEEKRVSRRGSGGSENGAHVYTVDHLVTWSIGSEHGVLTHQDGMRQLSNMEKETGVFTMRCLLTVDTSSVQIVDGQTGNAMESFPLSCIRDPVAGKDKNGMFNNIVLFTVVDEPKNKHSASDMHIFQVAGRSARELAEDIAEAIVSQKDGANRPSTSRQDSTQGTPHGGNNYGNGRQAISVQDAINKLEITRHQEQEDALRASNSKEHIPVSRRTLESEGDSEEDIKLGVALLNRCFDDLERFVLRLKHSAKAFQELSSRKKQSKGRKHGEGMLTMRSRAPAPAEFVECFQKVKLSFNLMARLRSYLHNPNSTELVHFLFTPLSLLVEASNDPRFDIFDLVTKVVTPLLSKQAVEMLENCLTSKEYEFWMSLGEPWTTPRHKYTQSQGQAFRPKFNDGYQPPESWLEVFLGDIAKQVAREAVDRLSRNSEDEPGQHYNGVHAEREADSRRRFSATVSPPATAQRPTDIPIYTDRSRASNGNGAVTNRSSVGDDYQKAYLRDLQQRSARIYEVILDRKGNNAKELTVKKGEILEVLEDKRLWWKCSNINGDQGFVPYSLLKLYENVDGTSASVSPQAPLSVQSPLNNDAYYSPRSSVGSATATPAAVVPAPPPPPPPPLMLPPTTSNWKLGKKSSSSSSKASRKADAFDLELKQRLNRLNDSTNGPKLASALSPQVFIDEYASAEDVTDWLKQKGFQEQTWRVLSGYTGSELFHLSNDALTAEFGHQEGSRLVSQIKLMKTTAGYTVSGSSQLQKILARRKQRAENGEENSGSEDSEELASASVVRGNADNTGRRY